MTGCCLRLARLTVVIWAAWACCAASAAEPPLPTAEEVLAGYQRNRAALAAPHVTLRRTLRATAEMQAWLKREAAKLEQLLADPERSEKQREQAAVILEETRAALAAGDDATYFHLDYWTDRRSWQARLPFPGPDGLQPPRHEFPTAPLTTAAYLSAYPRHRIYTYLAAGQGVLRAWYGLPNPGAPAYGRIAEAVRDTLPEELDSPPLAAVDGPGGLPAHRIDQIFSPTAGPLRVVRREVLDGRTLVRIERQSLAPSDEPHQTPGKLLAGNLLSAWLDPERGYLPVRAEWRRVWQFNGQPLNGDHRHVYEILQTSKIEPVARDTFYPLAGRVALRSIDPDHQTIPDIDQLIAGARFNPPMLTDHELLWEVETLEPGAAADPSLFQATFPPGTEVFDEKRLHEPRAAAPLALGQPAPALRVTRWSDGQQRQLSQYQGRVVVLYFWTAWQDPCTGPLAVLDQLERGYGAKGLAVLGVHVGNIELDALKRALAAEQVSFPSALDSGTEQTANSTLARYRVSAYPTTVVVDRAGRVAFTSDGPAAVALWRQAAAKLKLTYPPNPQRSAEEQQREWNQIYQVALTDKIEELLGAR